MFYILPIYSSVFFAVFLLIANLREERGRAETEIQPKCCGF